MVKQKLVIIVGPTASGKSNLAITIAKQFRGEVISADSRQVYRGLDIGTAKIAKVDMQGVPHHLIDIVDIDTVYTTTDFKRDAKTCINDIAARGHLPIIAGGTFFYIDTLLERVAPPKVAPNPTLRTKLEAQPVEVLFALLKKKDPRRAAEIDSKNKRRLVRALEIIDQLGVVPENKVKPLPYDVLMLGIRTDTADLRQRLEARAKTWLKAGFVEEIAELIKTGVPRERLNEIGFEYQLGLNLLDGTITQAQFIEVFVQKNWQYAKRQMTWLKRDKSINWVSPADRSEVELFVTHFLTAN